MPHFSGYVSVFLVLEFKEVGLWSVLLLVRLVLRRERNLSKETNTGNFNLFLVFLPKGLVLFHTSVQRDANNHEQTIHTLTFFFQTTYQILPCKRNILLTLEVRNTENVASLPHSHGMILQCWKKAANMYLYECKVHYKPAHRHSTWIKRTYS